MARSTEVELARSALVMDAQVRAKAPLVHHITNYVVMNFTANVTLALGGQPVMAHAPQELEQMTALASVLVLNIGTLDTEWIDSMMRAGEAAGARGIPIVVDPVGAGATSLRTDTAREMLRRLRVSVLRGNPGEILAVAGEAGKVRGVDSIATADEARDVAGRLARARDLVVAVTGPVDMVTDGRTTYEVENGHPLLGRVTGTGCAATTAIGCFVGVSAPSDRCLATACALSVFGRAAEMAATRAAGPGTFVPLLLDALYAVPDAIEQDSLRMVRRS